MLRLYTCCFSKWTYWNVKVDVFHHAFTAQTGWSHGSFQGLLLYPFKTEVKLHALSWVDCVTFLAETWLHVIYFQTRNLQGLFSPPWRHPAPDFSSSFLGGVVSRFNLKIFLLRRYFLSILIERCTKQGLSYWSIKLVFPVLRFDINCGIEQLEELQPSSRLGTNQLVCWLSYWVMEKQRL